MSRLTRTTFSRESALRHAAGSVIESLEGRRLLAAPDIQPLPFDPNAPVEKTLFIPIATNDADGDAITYSIEVDGPDGANPSVQFVPRDNSFLQVDVEGFGIMQFQLYNNVAPETVRRITALADSGFYDNLRIARVVDDFVIQFGSPTAAAGDTNLNDDLSGGPDFTFDDEFDPDTLFTGDGQLAMANSGKDTNGSQVFITEGDTRFLDGLHTIFGQLVRGFDVRNAISEVETIPQTVADGDDADNQPDPNPAYPGYDAPASPIVINKVRTVSNESDGVLQFLTDTAGTYTVTLTATDSTGATDTQSFQVTAAADTENSPPVITPFDTNYIINAGQPLAFEVPAVDPEGDDFNYVVSFTDITTRGQANAAPVTSSDAGTVSIDQDTGVVTFTPAGGFTGAVNIYVYAEQAAANPPFADVQYDEQLVIVGVGEFAASGSPRSLTAIAGSALEDVTVASFTDMDPSGDAADWSATIDWGDGTVSEGTIVPGSTPGSFDVIGSHTYSQAVKSLPVLVALEGNEGAREQILSSASVLRIASLNTNSGTLTINGSSSADTITFDLEGTNLVVTVNGESETFAAADVGVVEIFAGDGDDTITLGDNAPGSRIFAGAGDDSVRGGLAADEIFGQAGDDELDGHGGNDSIEGGAGNDYLMGGTGINYSDATLLAGYFDRDTLIGGDGNDTLSGGLDTNLLQGGDGDDLLNGSGSRDTLEGGAGNDLLRGWGNTDLLVGGDGNDTLLGDAFEGPRGGAENGGPDTLEGGTGDDVLFGYFGNDLFRGGTGADSLFGGDGDDVDEENDDEDVVDSIETRG